MHYQIKLDLDIVHMYIKAKMIKQVIFIFNIQMKLSPLKLLILKSKMIYINNLRMMKLQYQKKLKMQMHNIC